MSDNLICPTHENGGKISMLGMVIHVDKEPTKYMLFILSTYKINHEQLDTLIAERRRLGDTVPK